MSSGYQHKRSGGGGAPTDADYLVGTANAGLSAEIAVGTTPGGELGGSWASPTVDATHSGSTHAATQAAAEATAAAALGAHEADTTSAHKLDDLAAPDDNTDLNASTSAHGLMQKYPGGTTTFLRADASFATPTASATPYSPFDPGTIVVPTANHMVMGGHLVLSGSENLTLQGTARLVITS
jgi:hypothetical protein